MKNILLKFVPILRKLSSDQTRKFLVRYRLFLVDCPPRYFDSKKANFFSYSILNPIKPKFSFFMELSLK